MRIDDIRIGERHRKDMGDIEALAKSIDEVGLLQPIVVTPDGTLIAGERRILACKMLGWQEIPTRIVDLDNLIVGESDENIVRKDFTPSEAVAIGAAREAIEKEAAKERQGTRTDLEHVEKFPTCSDGKDRALDRVAQAVGMSRPTYVKAKEVVEAAQQEPEKYGFLAEQMDKTGKVSGAHKRLKVLKRAEVLEEQIKTAPAVKCPCLLVASADDMPIGDDSVDLIITSPPYNLGDSTWPMGGDGRIPRNRGIGYEDTKDELEYQGWQIAVLRECYRVARPGASMFYNHKPRNRDGGLIHPMDWLRSPEQPWTLRQEIIWDRGSTHNHSAQLFWPEDERIYWLTKGAPALSERPIGMSTVWRFHGPVAGTWHPAPFAEDLPRLCLRAIATPGMVVLDPFAGSCTTCKEALAIGCDAIGVDINAQYLRKACIDNGWQIEGFIDLGAEDNDTKEVLR